MGSGEIPARTLQTKQMGILADSLRATLEAMKELDQESQRRTNELLRDMDKLIDELKSLDEI